MGACELESGDVGLAAIPIRKMTIGIAQTLLLIIDGRIAMPKRTTGDRPELKPVNVGAAAIDIGSKMHVAAVNPTCTDVPVRAFGTCTQDLHDMADWFKACGVTSVAMESTGVYWIPVYEVLEQRGFEVILVNARYAKNVPGRKTDVSDAAWLRQLHSYGLLRGSFRHYLETEGVTLPNKQTLAPLWSETARHLRLSPGQLADDDLKQILAGLFSIAGGVAALRTHEGSAHGHANKNYKIEARHARLAVHAAHTMAVFVLETWEARKKSNG